MTFIIDTVVKCSGDWVSDHGLVNEEIMQFLRLDFFTDGKAKGPEAYSGPMGSEISGDGLIRGPMANFKPIKGLVPMDLDQSLLQNGDVRNLYYFCRLVQTGPNCDMDLYKHFNRSQGHVHLGKNFEF